MAVGLTPIEEKLLFPIAGIQVGPANAGLRRTGRFDMLVVALEEGATVTGVFTQNRFCAAPVLICRERLVTSESIRAFCINTGWANAGTGQKGIEDALTVCDAAAKELSLPVETILPFSTGVTMEALPVDRILKGLPVAVGNLGVGQWVEAAEAIMTTDTMAKAASRQCMVGGQQVSVTGIAKGSGMIEPNMATMLAFIFTDANVSQSALSSMVKKAADQSFNRITVDGDTSTNDSFILVATHKVKHPVIENATSDGYQTLYQAIEEIALELAQAIVRDGEGATKFISILVEGGKNEEECERVGKSIANSSLVKTAFFASDPNLGRILSAIGNSGISDLNPHDIRMWLDDVLIAENGGRADSYEESAGQAIMSKPEVLIRVDLQRGSATGACYTCDLSYEYVKINAEYRS